MCLLSATGNAQFTRKAIMWLSAHSPPDCSRPTVVEGGPNASFSIDTTLRCIGGCYSYPWTAPFTIGEHSKLAKSKGTA